METRRKVVQEGAHLHHLPAGQHMRVSAKSSLSIGVAPNRDVRRPAVSIDKDRLDEGVDSRVRGCSAPSRSWAMKQC